MDDTPDIIARLNERLDTLDHRVFTLEHPSVTSPRVLAPTTPLLHIHSPQDTEAFSIAKTNGAFPMFGKAVLGIAGAFLLRSAAESGSFPKLAVIVLAIAYAGMWLVLAVRVRTMAWYTGIIYATTSGLILAPMLWELTLNFKVIPPSISAAVLAAFATAALALTWRRNLVSVFWVAYGTAIITALALMIATHDLAPFLWVILLTVLASEFAVYRGHRLNARILVAIVTDIAVSSLIFIYSGPSNARTEYASIGTALLLVLVSLPLLVYGVSVTIQTILRRQIITIFEITQTIIAFSFAVYGVISFTSGDHTIAIGIVCLVLSVVGYAAVFTRFNEKPVTRNYRVYATWSAALLLLGSVFCLPQIWLSGWLGIAAIAATLIGAQRSRPALEYHGAIYLAAAAFTSGLLGFTGRSLIGSTPITPTWILGFIFVSALLCYLAAGQFLKYQWTQWFPHLSSAALTASAGAALLVSLLLRITVDIHALKTSPLEFIQTLILCALALVLAYLGSRLRRSELIWIAYAALVFIAAKLLFEDLRHAHFVFIAASFCLYAGTLILLPRLAGSGQKEQHLEAIES